MQGTWVQAWSRKIPHAVEQLSPCATTTEPVRLEPLSHNYWAHVPRARAPQQKKPPQWEARASQRRVAPARRNYRKPVHSYEDPTQPKLNK